MLTCSKTASGHFPLFQPVKWFSVSHLHCFVWLLWEDNQRRYLMHRRNSVFHMNRGRPGIGWDPDVPCRWWPWGNWEEVCKLSCPAALIAGRHHFTCVWAMTWLCVCLHVWLHTCMFILTGDKMFSLCGWFQPENSCAGLWETWSSLQLIKVTQG